MTFLKKKQSAFSPSRVLAIGFLGMILLGAVLLWLPFSTRDGVALTPLDALFTATSAVCVTGLTVVDTAGTYSLTGQLIIILLIQLGGLGFMLFATSVLVLARRRISLRNRVLLHETMSMPGLSGAVRTALRFMGIVFVVELAGALVLSSQFIPRYGVWTGIYYGFFHAVSAFCNAGFDLFGAAGSLRQFQQNPLVLSTISLLIIIGGLGFAVVADLADHGFRLRKTSLHTRIVLVTTILLLVSGMVFFAAMEWNNPRTLAFEGAGAFDKLNNAWFQSTTTRTAGF
ncbi:MAG TPA: potassium transporter TrkG, partial [Clostridia bacterium]|nr:potassium transporter TrkG [Clostridia bacterium]